MPIEVLKRKMTRRGGTAVAYNVKLQAKKKKKKDIIPRKYNVIVANNVPRTFTSRTKKEEKP